jgi:hypothetical protein
LAGIWNVLRHVRPTSKPRPHFVFRERTWHAAVAKYVHVQWVWGSLSGSKKTRRCIGRTYCSRIQGRNVRQARMLLSASLWFLSCFEAVRPSKMLTKSTKSNGVLSSSADHYFLYINRLLAATDRSEAVSDIKEARGKGTATLYVRVLWTGFELVISVSELLKIVRSILISVQLSYFPCINLHCQRRNSTSSDTFGRCQRNSLPQHLPLIWVQQTACLRNMNIPCSLTYPIFSFNHCTSSHSQRVMKM